MTDLPGSVVVVIPAYQEAATIADIVRRCRSVGDVTEIVVIDDGSDDATAEDAAAAGAIVLRNPQNLGKGASLLRGLTHGMQAGAPLVATLDGDGQHRPEDLLLLLAAARAHPDRIVIGSRRRGGADAPRARFIANRVADFWISWAAGFPIDDSQSGFRAYPAALLRELRGGQGLAGRFGFESELLIAAGWRGVRTISVDIPAIYGTGTLRASHFRPVADIASIVLMVAGRLLRRGFYPAGLWRVLRRSRR